jgi:hypothetical protein
LLEARTGLGGEEAVGRDRLVPRLGTSMVDTQGNEIRPLSKREERERVSLIRQAFLYHKDLPRVVQKAIDVALDDDHKSQGAVLTTIMKTIVPPGAFLDEQKQTSAVSINITGLKLQESNVVDGEIVKEDSDDLS